MRFEEALKCMREGKLVMRPTHLVPRTIKNGKIVEVYTKFNGKLGYEPLDTMNTCNIIAGDWEIVNKKAQDNVKKSHNAEENKPKSEKKLTIQVEKEVYEAVLRNSVKVADLEAENMQLRQFCEEFNALSVAEENHKLKELLKECRDNIGDDIDECTDPKIELIAKIGEVLK